VLDLCTGDLGFGNRRTFDLEAYAPGCDQWLEVSSVSWYGDFQARRSNARFRPVEGKGTEILHTLNGSVLGWPRTWAAVVETYRQPDGSIAVPEVLRPYLGGAEALR
jgi:seryl-tRNA synthetase